MEQVLDAIEQPGEDRRLEADQHAHAPRERDRQPAGQRNGRGTGTSGRGSVTSGRQASAVSTAHDDRHEAARLPFEQQHFDRQQDRRDRRAEDRGHPRRRARETSSVLRSAALRWKRWASSEPIAPPVMMIGPSAPNGPPLPIETADESGLSSATLGDSRLFAVEDRLDGFGNAVPADLVRPEARHQADDQARRSPGSPAPPARPSC